MAASDTLTPEQFAAGLSDRLLHCRELGHTWRPSTVQWDPQARSYDRRLLCRNCRTVRIQLLDRSGHVLSNRYQYPDGYLAQNVARGVGRDAFRVEAVVRFLNTHSEQAS